MRIGIASEHGGLALLHHFSGQDRRIVMEAVAKSKALKPPLLPLHVSLPSPQLKSWKTTRNGAGGEDRAARGVNRWQRGEENQRTNERTSPLKITAGRFLWRRRRMRRSKAANDGRGRGSLPSLRRRLPRVAPQPRRRGDLKRRWLCVPQAHAWRCKGEGGVLPPLSLTSFVGIKLASKKRMKPRLMMLEELCPLVSSFPRGVHVRLVEVHECCFPPTVGPSVTKSSSLLSSEMSRQRKRLKGGGGGELEKIPLRAERGGGAQSGTSKLSVGRRFGALIV